MIRIVATFCFSLTLFCPVFCLADIDGDCSDHDQPNSKNCEAMSVGAVVVEPKIAETPLDQLLPAADTLAPPDARVFNAHGWLQRAARNRANTKSPPAATRQALLQTFLF